MTATAHSMPDRIITILRPPVIFSVRSFSVPITPPVAIAYLGAVLEKNGFAVNLVDAIGEAVHHIESMPRRRSAQGLSFDDIIDRIVPGTDILAVSIMFSQEWPLIRHLISRIKEAHPFLTIIAGGEHITALPEFSLRDCAALDFCGRGEGEELLLEFVSAMRRGRDVWGIAGLCYRDGDEIVINPRRGRILSLDALPWPAWHKLPIETYLSSNYGGVGINSGRTMPIVATRGCPFRCSFCSNQSMWGQKYLMRSPGAVIDEIKYYIDTFQATHIEFYDLTAIISKDWIMEFGRLYLDSNLTVTWSLPTGTRSEALDRDVIEMLFSTNCKYLVYAPESGSPVTLKAIHKEVNLDALIRSVKMAVKIGIHTRCNLVIGFPEETFKDLLATLCFQIKLAWYGVDDVPIYLFSPYPGSELFDCLKKSKHIPEINDDYFDSLLGQMDLKSSTVYSDKLSGHAIRRLRLFGMSLFYSLSYLLRPARIVRSFINIFITKTTNTVFEQRILEKIQRRSQAG
jgi:radical SAM superfamily enzyme YgiQ (UPF0313 family)